jgi:ATP-dependent Clp protease ATP-binding subunit ClpA
MEGATIHSQERPAASHPAPPGRRLAELAAEAAAAPNPGAALRKVADLRRELEAFERRQVAGALAAGASFAGIARELGISRQAVHRRFRDLASAQLPLLTAPDVSRVLRFALEDANAVGADDVGGEYVVLGALRAADIPAAIVLRSAGVTLERARVHVEAGAPRTKLFRRTAEARDVQPVLVGAAHEARARDARRIEVEHLLLGALREPGAGAPRMLRAMGVDPADVSERLRALLSSAAASGARR